MTPILLKSIVLFVLLFAGLVGAIHAQPYDDSQLRAFLTGPEDCQLPCFMGIRPGVTTIEEATMILTTHEWVGEIQVIYNRFGRPYQAQWSWSGLQPAFIDGSKQAYVVASEGVIELIGAETSISFGSLLLVLGVPDRGTTAVSDRGSSIVFYHAGYSSSSLGVQSMMRCPVHLRDIFETKVSISFIADINARFGGDEYRLSDWVNAQRCT